MTPAQAAVSDPWDRLLAPLLRARRFDEALVDEATLVTGVFHVSIGMEATSAALACVRSPDDVIMLGHRNHGHLAALGSDLELLYRELLGRDGGPQRGRAGSLHLADPGRGVPYTSAMLGGGAALGAGLGLAKRRRGAPGIVVVCFGDGAMGEGIIYETLNLTAAWRLPVLFVCENNSPAGGEGALARLAAAHGVESAVVDGRRPRDTLAVMAQAANHVRRDGGPRFLEVGSEPWPGNSTFLPHPTPWLDLASADDPPHDAFAAGDPVRAETRALLHGGTPLRELQVLDAQVTARARGALASAARAPLAPASAARDSVWAPA
jgi:TPP-dependent pyruvate/acetoin dehydrogenase alpha subunit